MIENEQNRMFSGMSDWEVAFISRPLTARYDESGNEIDYTDNINKNVRIVRYGRWLDSLGHTPSKEEIEEWNKNYVDYITRQ